MKKTALITGASSGIGLELAKLFARDNINLVLVARRLDRLNSLKANLESEFNIKAEAISIDLSLPNSGKELYKKIIDKDLQIDYLVNNAGFGQYGKFHEIKLLRHKEMLNVNIGILTELTHIFLPMMIQRGFGRILNIASTAAFLPGPFQAVYYATKAYVLSLSQGMAEELSGTNVKVTAYCPSATETEFAEVGGLKETPLFNKKIASSEKIADMAYTTLKKGKLVGISAPFEAFSFRWIFPLLSRKSILKISRKVMGN